ncbi:hypothetical protein, partial [Ralstonia pseudosolanacearum]|uniref:hypothetical protein n=4 Tax=Ralstonia pseudosolanacearum TaxID=1310165 RepID=UPI003CF511CA
MTGAFNNYDLFAAIGGITVAGVCSLGAVGTALFGFKRFRLPYDTKDGFPRGIANFLLFVPFILCFIFITPQNGKLVTLIALIGVPVGMFCFAQYNIAFRNHRFTKPVPSGWMIWKRDREEIIVGGKVLTKNARDRIAQTGKSEQETLAEAAYNPDEIWERSRDGVQNSFRRTESSKRSGCVTDDAKPDANGTLRAAWRGRFPPARGGVP